MLTMSIPTFSTVFSLNNSRLQLLTLNVALTALVAGVNIAVSSSSLHRSPFQLFLADGKTDKMDQDEEDSVVVSDEILEHN